ncbi:hypothetical protein [Streptomyces sp. Ru73]|uniref:hypothetical protein n=1 Tax=Streptomyces sp. Ru73 TaxID=2080748 RepID=UPI0015E39CF1|nr:hypothetical protein [Streptomyces sp. Ru73]
MQHIGTEGCTELALRVHRATGALVRGIVAIDGLRVLGPPDASLVAVAADGPDVDPFVVADEIREAGWYLQPQPAYGSSPATLHLTVTAAVAGEESVAALLDALAAAVRRARERGPAVVDPELRAAAAALDPDALTPEEIDAALELAGIGTSEALPERMAPGARGPAGDAAPGSRSACCRGHRTAVPGAGVSRART